MPEIIYMSVATMADKFEMSKGFIRGHINAGNLAAINISGNPHKPIWRIKLDDAQAFMEFLNDQAERALSA